MSKPFQKQCWFHIQISTLCYIHISKRFNTVLLSYSQIIHKVLWVIKFKMQLFPLISYMPRCSVLCPCYFSQRRNLFAKSWFTWLSCVSSALHFRSLLFKLIQCRSTTVSDLDHVDQSLASVWTATNVYILFLRCIISETKW